jgi:hypothetical protein
MRQNILANWHFMRILRVFIAGIIIIQSVVAKDVLIGLFGVLILSMAVFNIGCCSGGACYTNYKKDIQPTKDISYEELD